MITASSTPTRFKTHFTNEVHQGISDTTADKGGGNSGFRPHDLLEAALASCMTMWLVMQADKHGFALGKATTRVSLDRSSEKTVVFRYAIELEGNLSATEKETLLQAASTCPVHRTLSKNIIIAPADRTPGKKAEEEVPIERGKST